MMRFPAKWTILVVNPVDGFSVINHIHFFDSMQPHVFDGLASRYDDVTHDKFGFAKLLLGGMSVSSMSYLAPLSFICDNAFTYGLPCEGIVKFQCPKIQAMIFVFTFEVLFKSNVDIFLRNHRKVHGLYKEGVVSRALEHTNMWSMGNKIISLGSDDNNSGNPIVISTDRV